MDRRLNHETEKNGFVNIDLAKNRLLLPKCMKITVILLSEGTGLRHGLEGARGCRIITTKTKWNEYIQYVCSSIVVTIAISYFSFISLALLFINCNTIIYCLQLFAIKHNVRILSSDCDSHVFSFERATTLKRWKGDVHLPRAEWRPFEYEYEQIFSWMETRFWSPMTTLNH